MGSGLREGWEVRKLGEVCNISIGKTPSRGNKKFWDTEKETNNVWLSIRDLNNTQGKEIFDSREYISESGAKLFNFVKKGTLLVSFKLTLGRLAFAGSDLYTNEAIASLVIANNKKLNNEYLYYYLTFFDWEAETKGEVKVKGKTLNKAKLKEIKVFIPLLQEQQRIVAILDEAFSAMEKAKANAELNLKNAKELFESYLQNVFETKGEGWEEKTFIDVCEITSKLIDPKESKYQNLIHIGAGNIESEKGTLIDLKTAKEENLISGKFLFDETMVLYSKIRPYLIKVVKCDFKGLCSADIYPLVPIKDEIIKDFLYYILLSNNFTEYAIEGSQRAGMPKVNRKHLFDYTFYCPPIQQQNKIVKKLDTLSEQTKKLESIYTKKLQDLEELKKSILQKAFNGELI